MSTKIYCRVNQVQSEQRTYIYVSKYDQKYFPDVVTYFSLIDKESKKVFYVHMEAAGRIPGLGDFFELHPSIKKGTTICIEVVNPDIEYIIGVEK